jgi:DNA recombination protein RmuC
MTSGLLEAVLACVALLVGLGLGWWLARREGSTEMATVAERARGLAAERDRWLEQSKSLGQQSEAQRSELAAQLSQSRARQATLEAQLAAERSQSAEKIALLHDARESLGLQFKTLANDILEEKSKRFAEQNQASLGTLLDPLRSRLADFQGKVEQFYDAEGKQRSALSQQVSQLMDLNKLLGDEARSLTSALKGSSKAQGNWGELILERVLEASGLRRGHEYHVQQNHTREDGSRAQPDVVIQLPEERSLVVDAKVSLIAYEECVRAETDEARLLAQRRHLQSIRAHIDGLSARNYQQLYSLKTLDFVLMFVPIEPAFMLAVVADEQLFMDAWRRNVLLVSPSTLLFVVRTVAHLWRQEQQNRNAQEISRRGADLYDKLAAFVGDLEDIGRSLDKAQKSYGDAFKRLKTGRGNAIAQAERLRELGVKPTKSFSGGALEGALPDADHIGETLPPLTG